MFGDLEAVGVYCHIFEIIVLGRYVNQVQECLVSLPRTGAKTSELMGNIPAIWWPIMFSSVMSSNNEQCKKVIGTWIMENFIIEAADDKTELGATVHQAFFDAFFMWATSGQLAYKALVRDGRSIRSEHCELLSSWYDDPRSKHMFQWLTSIETRFFSSIIP